MNAEELSEEVFCLGFELRQLADFLIEGKTERWIEGFCNPNTHLEHIQRYQFAAGFVKDKRILDLACGAGHGCWLLAQEGGASEVIGCDIKKESIRYANHRHKHPRVDFRVADGLQLDVPDRFDAIISFETIEHVSDPLRMLRNFYRSLAPDGFLLVSTPISREDLDTSPSNPYHIQEWGFHRFQEMVSKVFQIRCIYVQYRWLSPEINPIARVVRKIRSLMPTFPNGIKQSKETPPEPHIQKWDSVGLDLRDVGRKWIGFAILECSKK